MPDTIGAPTRPGVAHTTLEVMPAGPLAITVDPWPFDTPQLAIGYPGRRLDGPVETQQELDAALERAPWTTVSVTWRRA
jgi:hypothetical protein